MKNTKGYLYALMACAALTFSACDKDDKEPGGLSEDPTVDEVINLPYSSLTPEQQKDKLAAEANAFINEMKGLNDAKTPEVLESLFDLMSNSDIPSGLENKIDGIEDIVAISEFYGKYTWNNGTWNESTSTDKFVIEFPVGNNNTNNGRLEVTGDASAFTMEGIVFPKLLSAKIFYNNAEVGSINAAGDVLTANDKPGVPATASLTINLDAYSIAQNFTKSNNTATLSLKKNGTELIGVTAKLDGNIDNMIEDEVEPNGGNFSMTLMDNLVLVGKIDYANYSKDEETLENQCSTATSFNDEKYAKGEAELFNKYFEIYLASAKDNTKIARLIEKVESESYSYGTDWYTMPYLRFDDKTEVAADVYFTEGFDTVIKNFEDFIESLGVFSEKDVPDTQPAQ